MLGLDTPRPIARALPVALAIVGALLFIPATADAADTVSSSNWSGYAVHESGVHFKRVTASWQEPSGTCTEQTPTYSAFWVGIGGYSTSSQALEQAGTELDCTRSGERRYYAWYEMVPAASHTIKMTIKSGDVMTGTVTVVGHAVTVILRDDTRHETFTRHFTPATVDTSSAEWIAEAPSGCTSESSCTVLPLTDFQGVLFGRASATTTTGYRGTISSSKWNATKIVLGAGDSGTAFASQDDLAEATPSALERGGSAFAVAYSESTTSTGTGTGTGTGTIGGGGPGGPPNPGGGFGAP